MKVIILAAGQGTRLRPLTDDKPKCMVNVFGKDIISYQLNAFKRNQIDNVVVVKGYKAEVLNYPNITYYYNEKYDTTNMVYSLFTAEAEFNDDIIISYGDIIYSDKVLQTLLNDQHDFAMTIDLDWFNLWSARMENPLEDAETLKLNEKGEITELGKKPKSLEDISGQFMGLIKIKKDKLKEIQQFYHSLDKESHYDGKSFEQMFSTSFFQLLIDNGMSIHAVKVNGGWIEIDCQSDIELFPKFLPDLVDNNETNTN